MTATAMTADFLNLCKTCLLFNGSGFYLIYGILVLIASITSFDIADRLEKDVSEHKQATAPPRIGDLATFSPPKVSVNALILGLIVHIASFDFFQVIMRKTLHFIRVVFMMSDNPSLLVSFRRYLVLYSLAIPLPAAFMPPVSHAQRKPDFQLLTAVVLLICINALGDVISVRMTLRNFEKLPFRKSETNDFWQGVRHEALYYFTVMKGAAYVFVVLVSVLALSSVLYGVQIGEIEFEPSKVFFLEAWHRMLAFPDLAFELYWFRDQPGPLGLAGIPGLFLYGLTTFIPIIILFCLALIWLLLIPLRIAVNLPASPWLRVISSEFAVIVVCIFASYALNINVLNIYILLMHAWTT